MILRIVSVVGALAILLAYAANQFGWSDASSLCPCRRIFPESSVPPQ